MITSLHFRTLLFVDEAVVEPRNNTLFPFYLEGTDRRVLKTNKTHCMFPVI